MRVFLSARLDADEGSGSQSRVVDLIREVAAEVGVEIVVSDSRLDTPTNSVPEDLRSCHAFLQVLSLKENETKDNHQLHWLMMEEFGANLLRIPRAILAEESKLALKEWREVLATRTTLPIRGFNPGAKRDALMTVFRDALRELVNEARRKFRT